MLTREELDPTRPHIVERYSFLSDGRKIYVDCCRPLVEVMAGPPAQPPVIVKRPKVTRQKA